MKIFISQPMAGKSNEEIIKAKKVALDKFSKYIAKKYENQCEIEVIDTFFKDFNGNALQFLGKAIFDGLALADIAIFLPDWSNARGCRIEHDIAVAYGIKTFYINEV